MKQKLFAAVAIVAAAASSHLATKAVAIKYPGPLRNAGRGALSGREKYAGRMYGRSVAWLKGEKPCEPCGSKFHREDARRIEVIRS